jgi:hypothetical protein
MEQIAGLLGGLGVLGLVGAFILGLVTLLVLPWWAIFDCIFSRRSGGLKVVGVLLLLVTWGLGSLIYGLFVTTSRSLRIATAVAFGGVFLLFAAGGVTLLAGAGVHAKVHTEEVRQERQEIAEQFKPAALPATDVGAFRALHVTYSAYGAKTAALARFTGPGPDFGSARDTDRNVRQVACDPEGARCWAVTSQEFGSIDPATGRFTKIEVDPKPTDFSSPKGIAYDSKERKVYLMTCGVFTYFFRFDPATGAWDRLPAEIRGLSIVGLTYSASDDCLYAMEHETHDQAIRRLQRFNTSGASLGPIDLRPVIPIQAGTEDRFQIQASGGKLALILPPESPIVGTAGIVSGVSSANRAFAVDPSTGEVFTFAAAR